MGIPKFFRWLSERYPLCSQLISPHNVPEFDNFYLDMNGIIHNCSRAITSSDQPYTEAEIFESIFAYVSSLFEKIKPKKVLFLAIDGVAPRAKVNQQRSRRFRSAKEARVEAEKAAAKRKEIVNEAKWAERFDSNCITPGTEFLHRLGVQMRKMISERVASDVAWRNVQIIFSGPDVPGEGEHKIMEFIRLNKAKADYDPNVRHCLYGLDADLILLGLLSHDPHFALLREEVLFKSRLNDMKRNANDIRFYLLHLGLIREYMSLEFGTLVENVSSVSSYTLETLINDFILLMCLVGNDFLPNLPGVHLGEGILEIIFSAYKKALPKMKGLHSLNNNGNVNFFNLSIVLNELISVESSLLSTENPSAFDPSAQRKAHEAIKMRTEMENFILDPDQQIWSRSIDDLSGKERSTVSQTAQLFILYMKRNTSSIILEKSKDFYNTSSEDLRVKLDKYRKETQDLIELADTDIVWKDWKRKYYLEKLNFDIYTEEGEVDLAQMLSNYAEGLQWNMLYYFQGVASWSWFYKYHYAPHISDLVPFMETFVCPKFHFDSPLTPLEQLMAVLPPASAKLVPKLLSLLMTSANSPILSFYPKDFETDANGKKASYEAIVKIPFIDATKLKSAINELIPRLSGDEIKRNQFGNTLSYFYNTSLNSAEETIYELPVLCPDEKFVAALCQGVRTGINTMPGFPTLSTLPLTAELDSGIGLLVYGQAAKGLSLTLAINEGGVFSSLLKKGSGMEKVAEQILGKTVFIDWPHMQEAIAVRLCDGIFFYDFDPNNGGNIITRQLSASDMDNFVAICETIEGEYRKKCAILLGNVPAVVWVKPFSGMAMNSDGSMHKLYSEGETIPCALQTILLPSSRPDFVDCHSTHANPSTTQPISNLFPLHGKVVCLSKEDYGLIGEVEGYGKGEEEGENKVNVLFDSQTCSPASFPSLVTLTPNFSHETGHQFVPFPDICHKVGVSALLLSKLMGSISFFINGNIIRSCDLGLRLKFEKRRLFALGLLRKEVGGKGWKAHVSIVNLLISIKANFPNIFAALERKKHVGDLEAFEVFPNVKTEDDLKTAAAPIIDFIKAHLSTVHLVSMDDEYMEPSMIAKVQQEIATYKLSNSSLGTKKSFRKTIGMNHLLSPVTGTMRLRSLQRTEKVAPFKLGDRVVYLGQEVIPFASTGTIIGIETKGLDKKLYLLLDNQVAGLNSPNDLVATGFGVLVDALSCLNISNTSVATKTIPSVPTVQTMKPSAAKPIPSVPTVQTMKPTAAKTIPSVPTVQTIKSYSSISNIPPVTRNIPSVPTIQTMKPEELIQAVSLSSTKPAAAKQVAPLTKEAENSGFKLLSILRGGDGAGQQKSVSRETDKTPVAIRRVASVQSVSADPIKSPSPNSATILKPNLERVRYSRTNSVDQQPPPSQ